MLSVAISPSSITLDTGQSQTFTATVSGGTPPFTYRWYLNGSLIGANNSSYSYYAPTFAFGVYSVYVNATDNASVPVTAKSNTASVTVHAAPSVLISPTSAVLDVGQPQTFNATVSNGTSSYSYQWYLNGSAVSNATGDSWTFNPTSTGSYNVYVKVTDAAGTVATSITSTVTVQSVIPEFEPYMLLPLLMIITLLTAAVSKSKRNVMHVTKSAKD
jgi:hypothetical protein